MEFSKISDHTEVSKICIGGNIFGYSCFEKEASDILGFAADIGVNMIDTADVYSDGVSEEIIGKIIKKDRDAWTVASKIGVNSGHDGSGVLYEKNIREKLFNSLRRLKTDCIDLYQVHKFDSEANQDDVVACLNQLKKEGHIKNYGFSNFTKKQIKHYSLKESQFISNQVYFNYAKRFIFDALDHSNPNMKYMVYGVLGRGVLSDKYLSAEHDKSSRGFKSLNVRNDLQEGFLTQLKLIQEYLRGFDVSMSEYAVLKALHEPNIAVSIIAFRTREQIELIDRVYKKKINIKEIDRCIPYIDASMVTLGAPY